MDTGYVLSERNLSSWLDSLTRDFVILGPALKKKGQVVFEKIHEIKDLHLDYCSTMASPRKFIYPPRSDLIRINLEDNQYQSVPSPEERNRIIFGMHPCDMHAISVLDKTFLGDFKDSQYTELRKETITVVLNCNKACDKGFCVSMGTGPFLKLTEGYDIQLTMKQEDYLVESGSERGRTLVGKVSNLRTATKKDLRQKFELEREATDSFTEHLETEGLPELLMRNLDHHVYKETADARCLGCTNCTMVCPTCYCYNIEDNTSFDLKISVRERHWDSCQELNFVKVSGGNLRSSREARLRQFVTHKLATWVEQYGCFGCVGCGRCMTWCPTGIDLTEIAGQIQEDHKRGKAR